MIKVIYTDTTIEVTGHANFAKKGNDIVCAGVSAIVLGALKWFDAKDVEIKNKHGKFTITLKNRKPKNMMLLDLIVTQLKPIAKKYKKYVKIKRGR